MSNVIVGYFGVDESDKNSLAEIYNAASIAGNSDESFEKRFNLLSVYALKERKALLIAYEKLQDYLAEKQHVFYSGGQKYTDMEKMQEIRKILESIDLHIVGIEE